MTQLHFEADIPYFWTAMFHWAAYMLFITLLPKRMKKLPTILISLLLLPVQVSLFRVIASLRGTPFNLAMAGFALWTLFPFAMLTDISIKNHIYYCARAFTLGGFVAAFTWQIYRFYSVRYPALATTLWENLLNYAIGLIVLTLVWLLERRRRTEMREMEMTWPRVAETVLIALGVYILSSLSYTSLDTPFSAQTESQVFMVRTMVYFAGLAILFALHLNQCETYAKSVRDALKSILERQYENFRVRQESINLVNQKYHDLKHQIALLRSEIGTDRKLAYLDQVENEIRTYEAQNKTGNEVLDAILTGKSLYCAEHGITMTAVADGHALDFMSVMDLSALFGNALDNAIEAAEQVPDPEQRLIVLSVSQQKGFVKMQFRNRYLSGETITSLPATTKNDKRYHGYGLKSIRSTVEKYGGSVAVHGEDGWFELGILIPHEETPKA